ncbi:hypothetical protein T484DRAFT_1924462 [Baffinella frigidus]|nr:hypothetical protein T484DRAFT_1924462 [Cryptophyta sp. CCMP2293]
MDRCSKGASSGQNSAPLSTSTGGSWCAKRRWRAGEASTSLFSSRCTNWRRMARSWSGGASAPFESCTSPTTTALLRRRCAWRCVRKRPSPRQLSLSRFKATGATTIRWRMRSGIRRRLTSGWRWSGRTPRKSLRFASSSSRSRKRKYSSSSAAGPSPGRLLAGRRQALSESPRASLANNPTGSPHPRDAGFRWSDHEENASGSGAAPRSYPLSDQRANNRPWKP